MVAFQHLEGEIIQLVLSRKEGGHVPCKCNSSLLDFYETLHICNTLPADVHERIWLLSKIWKGDNLTYTLKYVLYGEMGL